MQAQQQVAEAQGQADANKVLNGEPLSDAALKQREIEALHGADARVGGAGTFGMNAIVVAGVDQMLRVGQAVRANYVFG